MAIERTFSIIKPDATRRNITGKVMSYLEDGGLRVIAQKRIHMTQAQAEGFYGVHKERPFFNDLVELHDLRPGRRAGARGRERRLREPRDHGRHQPGQRRPRHHPQGFCGSFDRGQFGARLRRPGDGEAKRSPFSSRTTKSSADRQERLRLRASLTLALVAQVCNIPESAAITRRSPALAIARTDRGRRAISAAPGETTKREAGI